MHPRFELHTGTTSVAAWAGIAPQALPTESIDQHTSGKRLHPVLRLAADHHREIAWMREGLILSYACDDQDAEQRVEAHAEAMTCASCFRSAFRRRRCIVPATVLHEVRHLSPGITHPCSFSLLTGEIFGLAAVWETWINDQGHTVESFAIVTVLVTPLLRSLFERMPVILQSAEEAERWLSGKGSETPPVDLLKPLSPGQLREWKMTPDAVELRMDEAVRAHHQRPSAGAVL